MCRIVVVVLLSSFAVLIAEDKPLRSSSEVLRGQKALQAVKAYTGETGSALPEQVLIDIGLVDRLPVAEAENLEKVCEILLVHMHPDKPVPLATAAGLSLYSILQNNTPTGNDYPSLKAYHLLQREWTTKVLANKALRDQATFRQYLIVK